MFEELFLEYRGEHGKEADWPVGSWVSVRFMNHYYIGVFPEEWKVCSSENGVVEIGKENYCLFREETKNFDSNQVKAWSFTNRETLDHIDNLRRGDSTGRKGEL